MAQKPDYRYTPVPTNLMLCLDNNCRSVLFSLIQLSTYYESNNNDFDGWFFRSNSDLEAETNLSKNVLSGALDSLYKEKLIDIVPQQKSKGVKQESRKYKVLYDEFRRFEDISIEDCFKNPDNKIVTSDYKHGCPSFQQTLQPTSLPTSQQPLGRSDNNINNIDNVYNIDNNNNRINKLLNNSNLLVNSNSLFLDNNREMVDMNECEYHNTISKVKEIQKRQLNGEELSYSKSLDKSPGEGEDKEYNKSKFEDSEPTPVAKEDERVAPAIRCEPTTEMSIAEYNEQLFEDAIYQLVDMERGVCKKDDRVFYRAADLYGLLYGIIDRKEACKEVQLIVNELVKDTQAAQ